MVVLWVPLLPVSQNSLMKLLFLRWVKKRVDLAQGVDCKVIQAFVEEVVYVVWKTTK